MIDRKKLGVVYFSKTGVTAQLVNSFIEGVDGNNQIEIIKQRVFGKDIFEGRYVNMKSIDSLTSCDAIIFATPTYMGGVSAQLKSFLDATSELWCKQLWAGKFAAGITCGSALNGDQSSTLQYLITFANQQGMLWVGLDTPFGYTDEPVNRLGCQLGVTAQSDGEMPSKEDLNTARYLGERVATIVGKN